MSTHSLKALLVGLVLASVSLLSFAQSCPNGCPNWPICLCLDEIQAKAGMDATGTLISADGSKPWLGRTSNIPLIVAIADTARKCVRPRTPETAASICSSRTP